LVSPRQLADELAIPLYGAAALRAGRVLIELAAHADVVASQDFLVAARWHTSGDVLGRCDSKVSGLLKPCRSVGVAYQPAFLMRIGWVLLVNSDAIAVFPDDARTDLIKRIASLNAPCHKVAHLTLNHGNGLQPGSVAGGIGVG